MNKKDLYREVANKLRQKNIRKPVKSASEEFIITDSTGDSHRFVVKGSARDYIYTVKDAENILEMAAEAIIEAAGRGEEISYCGLGIIAPKYYRNAAISKNVNMNDPSAALECGVYRPKFRAGKSLKEAYKNLNIVLKENEELLVAIQTGMLTTSFDNEEELDDEKDEADSTYDEEGD